MLERSTAGKISGNPCRGTRIRTRRQKNRLDLGWTVVNTKKKFRLTPIHGFLGVVGITVLATISCDIYNRSQAKVQSVSLDQPQTLDDLDLERLRLKYDAIRIDSASMRPSTKKAVDERVEIAKVMVRKSETADELAASRELLMNAMKNRYALLRAFKMDPETVAAVESEFMDIVRLVSSEGEGEARRTALVYGFDLNKNRILENVAPPEVMEDMAWFLKEIRTDFPETGTVAQIERTVIDLLFTDNKDPRIDGVIRLVSQTWADHPDEKIRQWSVGLTDDLIFRELDMFEIYERIQKAIPEASADFLQLLPGFFRRKPSVRCIERVVAIGADMESMGNYGDAKKTYEAILQQLDENGLAGMDRARQLSEYGLRRLASLNQHVTASFTDASGKTQAFTDEQFSRNAFLVMYVTSAAMFHDRYENTFSVESLNSRKIQLLVVCLGMTADQIKQDMDGLVETGIILVPDPDNSSEIFQFMPTLIWPAFWTISREHTVSGISLLPNSLAQELEALRFDSF